MSPSPRTVRLDRLLANLGYGSRREVHVLVGAAAVRVGGVVVVDASMAVPDDSTGHASVLVDGEPLDHPGRLVIALHKPSGGVCSHDDGEGPSVYDLLPARWNRRNPRVESVGRLDRDTTGLLLLTDDHQLLHRLTSPKHHVPKRYVAVLDGPPGVDTEAVLRSGALVLRGERAACLPVVGYELLASDQVAVTVVEGRYHQVRRMFEATGSRVTALHRTAVGALQLGTLGPGEHRLLGDDEVAGLLGPRGL